MAGADEVDGVLAGDQGLKVVGDGQVGPIDRAGGLGLADQLVGRGAGEELEADEVDRRGPSRGPSG